MRMQLGAEPCPCDDMLGWSRTGLQIGRPQAAASATGVWVWGEEILLLPPETRQKNAPKPIDGDPWVGGAGRGWMDGSCGRLRWQQSRVILEGLGCANGRAGGQGRGRPSRTAAVRCWEGVGWWVAFPGGCWSGLGPLWCALPCSSLELHCSARSGWRHSKQQSVCRGLLAR